MPVTTYLEKLYALKGVDGSFDAIAIHPYAADANASVDELESARARRQEGPRRQRRHVGERDRLGRPRPADNPYVKGKAGQAQVLTRALSAYQRAGAKPPPARRVLVLVARQEGRGRDLRVVRPRGAAGQERLGRSPPGRRSSASLAGESGAGRGAAGRRWRWRRRWRSACARRARRRRSRRSFFGVGPQGPLDVLDYRADGPGTRRHAALRDRLGGGPTARPGRARSIGSPPMRWSPSAARQGIQTLPFVYDTPRWVLDLDGTAPARQLRALRAHRASRASPPSAVPRRRGRPLRARGQLLGGAPAAPEVSDQRLADLERAELAQPSFARSRTSAPTGS